MGVQQIYQADKFGQNQRARSREAGKVLGMPSAGDGCVLLECQPVTKDQWFPSALFEAHPMYFAFVLVENLK